MPIGYATERGLFITVSGKLITEECPYCGIVFAMPSEFNANARNNKTRFYCPNGHCASYSESEADQLRKQLESQRSALAVTQDLLNGERRSHAATKGQLTKTMIRIHDGVCPECNRTFKQLARHMRARHKGAEEANKLSGDMKVGKQ